MIANIDLELFYLKKRYEELDFLIDINPSDNF